jgi:periplasmic protein TonB
MISYRDVLEAPGLRFSRWIGAAALVGLLHCGGGALAIYQWPEEETDADPNGAFLLELAPMATAPPTEKLNLAYGPRAEESAPTVTPTEEVKEKAEVETPPVDPSPLAPDPEVVLPKPKEVKDTEEKEKEEEQQPEQVALQQSSYASNQASAPPPIDAAPGEKFAAPRAGLSTKPSQAELSWRKALVQHLNRHKKYPREARRDGAEGTVEVAFTLDRSGKVLSARLVDSSGSVALDEEAIAVLERASPFPAPPSDMAKLSVSLMLPIRFQIHD